MVGMHRCGWLVIVAAYAAAEPEEACTPAVLPVLDLAPFAGGLAFLLVEFAVLVFVEPLEDLLPECLTVGAFPATWRPLCRLCKRRLAKRDCEAKRQG